MSEKLVRDWRDTKVTIKAMKKKTKKSYRGLKAQWPEQVHKWVHEQHAADGGLTTVQFRLHGHIIAKEMNMNGFASGPSWCYRLVRHNHLSIRAWTTMCHKLPPDFPGKVDSFRAFIEKEVTALNVFPDCVINMD